MNVIHVIGDGREGLFIVLRSRNARGVWHGLPIYGIKSGIDNGRVRKVNSGKTKPFLVGLKPTENLPKPTHNVNRQVITSHFILFSVVVDTFRSCDVVKISICTILPIDTDDMLTLPYSAGPRRPSLQLPCSRETDTD